MRLAPIQISWSPLLRLTLHVVVRVSLRYAPKTQSLIKLKCPAILQPSRKSHPFSLLTSLSNSVAQDACTNTATLIGRLDLNLANLYSMGVLKQLNHTRTHSIDFDSVDFTAFPTFGAMSKVSSFVPATPCCDEQIQVHGSAQLLEPPLVLSSRRD
jgi:hypothetical protein